MKQLKSLLCKKHIINRNMKKIIQLLNKKMVKTAIKMGFIYKCLK